MKVGSYELLDKVGAGAFGVTHRARHVDSGEIVAIKSLRLAGLPEWKPLERFEREAKVLRSLSHPGVVRFIEAFEVVEDDEPAFHIVSEFVEGPTLGEKIADGDRWSEDQVRALLETLLETLEYLHGLSPRAEPPPRQSKALARTNAGPLALAEVPRAITPRVRNVLSTGRAAQSGSTVGNAVVVSALVVAGALVPAMVIPGLGSLIAGIAISGTSVWGYFAAKRARTLDLFERGETTTGKVLSIKNHQGSNQVRYSFEVDGRTYSGMFGTGDVLAIRDLDRGDPIHIFYQAGNPDRHIGLTPRELERALSRD